MLAGTLAQGFHAPAAKLGVAGVHAEQVPCEQRCLIASGAGAHLEEQVSLIMRILRDQELLQFQFLRRHLRRQLRKFIPAKFP